MCSINKLNFNKLQLQFQKNMIGLELQCSILLIQGLSELTGLFLVYATTPSMQPLPHKHPHGGFTIYH